MPRSKLQADKTVKRGAAPAKGVDTQTSNRVQAAKAAPTVRKRARDREADRKVYRQMREVNLVFRRATFKRMLRDVLFRNIGVHDQRISKQAALNLQIGLEAYLVKFLRDANLVCTQNKRRIVGRRDMDVVKNTLDGPKICRSPPEQQSDRAGKGGREGGREEGGGGEEEEVE